MLKSSDIFAFILLALLSCMYSCNSIHKTNFEKEKEEILALDAKAREFHFTKNAKAMAEGFSNEFISLNKGVISKPTYDDNFNRFDRYFKSVEFLKWDNVTPPDVRFSDDASVAYVAVDKLVILKLKDDTGKEVLDTTKFAWLSVFKKIKKKWVLDCIASTNK